MKHFLCLNAIFRFDKDRYELVQALQTRADEIEKLLCERNRLNGIMTRQTKVIKSLEVRVVQFDKLQQELIETQTQLQVLL